MKKKDLIKALALETGLTQNKMTEVFDRTFEAIKGYVLEGEEISIRNFGKFYRYDYPERTCRKPVTGEAVIAPAKSIIRFNKF